MPIPAFASNNVLPPFVGSWPGAPLGFAPYRATLAEVVAAFGTSDHRRGILVGFIDLRAKLRNLGFPIQLQWLDGSFTEEIEVSEGRPPGDIDVVTFAERPALAKSDIQFSALANANLDVVVPSQSKTTYRVDHYLIDLDLGLPIDRICYWNAVFSHRRNGLWKGYVELIDEGAVIDQNARAALIASGVS